MSPEDTRAILLQRGIDVSRRSTLVLAVLSVAKLIVGLAKEVGEGPYHVLRDSSIQIFDLNEESDIERVLDAFSKKDLKSLVRPRESG